MAAVIGWLVVAGVVLVLLSAERDLLIHNIRYEVYEKDLMAFYTGPSAKQMFWDLRKWKFEDFYPGV